MLLPGMPTLLCSSGEVQSSPSQELQQVRGMVNSLDLMTVGTALSTISKGEGEKDIFPMPMPPHLKWLGHLSPFLHPGVWLTLDPALQSVAVGER